MLAQRKVITRAFGPRFILEAQKKSIRSYIFPVLLGLVGAAILCALGVWQLQRLDWKESRQILVDLGFVPEAAKDEERPEGSFLITGNIIWPDETDGFTPEPNLERNIWFARNVETMSEALNTDPIMVSARSTIPETPITPLPVTPNIKNDHLEYAITWFSLMGVWIVMTLLWVWRIKRADA